MKSDQILQQHFAANQFFLSASLQVCLLMSVGRSPTYRSLPFPASTHSLAMWAGAALHQKRCKSNSKSIDEQQSLKKKENFLDYAPTIATTWLHSSSAKQLQQLRCAAHQGAIIFAQHPRLEHFFFKLCRKIPGLFSNCFGQKKLQRKRSNMTCPIALI